MAKRPPLYTGEENSKRFDFVIDDDDFEEHTRGFVPATTAANTQKWDKELSREDDHVSDKKMPQADAQAEEISSTLETAQKRLPQTDHVVSALTQDQATDVTKSQMTSLKEAQGIVHPQAAQVVVVCQATALLTVHKCPQFTQTLTLPTSQVTVQTVYDPPQSGVMVTAAQMWEAPQARALPVAQVCTFEEAPISAPAAVQVGCTFETDLVLVPQAPQECALDVDQGTSVQTGQVSVFSSHVAGCKAGDGVAPISKTGSQSCAETSHYTECTAFPTSDELSHSTASQFPQLAPPRIVIDDVVVQKKCKVDVQPSPHVSDNQSGSEEAGNDDVPGDDSVAPNPSTGEVVVISSSVSMFARNMVGLPTCTLYTGKMEQQHKNVPTKEDSEERKKKAMDRLRKEREERVKQNTGAEKTRSATRSSFSKASKGVGDSDVRTQTHQTSHAATKGLVHLSNVPHIFQEGAYVPLPSQEAMAEPIGKGGNGVVSYIYHGGMEFAVKETGLRQEELETWSSVNHRNVIELCAVVVGDWDSGYPETRRCYQMMPRMTGDLKSLLDKERPTLCHYFFDFKGDSERMNLVLGNAKYILLGVLNGLKHLHSLGIMHRDIKLQNILIDCHCQCRDIFLCSHDGDSGYGVFISDFDSALQVDRGREKLETRKLHGRPIKYSVHGTPGYRPPETSFHMFCEEVLPEWVSLKTDVWSFGTMVVRLFVGSRGPHSQREMATLLLADCLQSPTAAQTPEGVKISSLRQALAVRPDEVQKLQKVDQVEKHLPLAVDLYQLVQSCLTVNSEKRPTVGQVMGEPFFRAEQRGSESMATSAEGRGQGVGGCQITADSVAPSYEGKSRSPISRYNCTQKPMVQDN